jgi:TPR repeat protein
MPAQSPERCRRLFAADAPSLPPELLAEEAARERWLARAEAECLAAAKAEAEAEAPEPAAERAAALCAMGWRRFHERDFAAARTWFRRAGDAGFAHAHRVLAGLVLNGKGGAADEREAARLYALAAARGLPDAAFALGRMRELGRGGAAPDAAEARRLYAQAAAAGFSHAVNALSRLDGRHSG